MNASQLLLFAAHLIELNPTVFLADVLDCFEEIDGSTTAPYASQVLNEHLNFPAGTWHQWQDRTPHAEILKAIRDAAEKAA